ncbi:hypothetical protein Taro_022476 [Colocasia esculenta]|uniref:TITAN-like protein n=1 Tax=Colocasia esculenta TaxID=4460 RepID=A0A843V8I0_COLES|nr:hypothetical protein [Colocasia esculenta]
MRTDEARTSASGEEEKRAAAASPFEFCKVCNLNHNQGRKHRYFPSHIKALSRFLSRFQGKLSDIRSFLKNPSPLRPEHAARNGLWCVFCDADVSEVGSSFVCNNAIYHLASSEHHKSLKHFLWLHGGGMDRVDSFIISEADLLKWEKKCEASKVAAPIVCDKDSGRPSLTNEVLLGSPLGSSEIGNFSAAYPGKVLSPMGLQQDTVTQNAQPSGSKMNSLIDGQTRLLSNDVRKPAFFSSINILQDNKRDSEEELSNEGHVINITNGARPPWLEENENFDVISQESRPSSTNTSRKSRKFNHKQVGAAWAAKRKAELEREKRGELVAHDYDANWLPNFGRVWQQGTRKETRKEFEMEKQQSCNSGRRQPEVSVNLQPYISKRMDEDGSKTEWLLNRMDLGRASGCSQVAALITKDGSAGFVRN